MGLEQPISSSDNFFVGEDKTIVFDVKDTDGVSALTMTGWALTWELKASAGGVISITKTTAAATIVLSNKYGTNDRASVTILDTDTEAIAAGSYYHHLRRTDAGYEQILAFGDVSLRESGL